VTVISRIGKRQALKNWCTRMPSGRSSLAVSSTVRQRGVRGSLDPNILGLLQSQIPDTGYLLYSYVEQVDGERQIAFVKLRCVNHM